MIFSRYNIFSRIRDSENYFIVNLLSGNADILTPEDAEKVRNATEEREIDNALQKDLIDKGYLVNETEEAREYRRKYLDFLDIRDKDEIQIFFVTNYSCNFSCNYCYQDQYDYPAIALNREVVDAFFNYVNKEFAGRKKYVTIFGGEPLLNTPVQKDNIGYLVQKSNEAGLSLCFVTNGYYLEEYIPLLMKSEIREIQVTLDGTEAVHNGRRSLREETEHLKK
jgi:uncharacterized protein